MLRRFFTLPILFALLLSGCFHNKEEPLKLSVNSWIGYTPLFYAKAKGWLDPLDIKLLHVVSLNESLFLYKSANADAMTGTQYEFGLLSDDDSTIAIMLFDRSNGGDLIMSNISEDALLKSKDRIRVYLEMDSVNQLLLEHFIKSRGLSRERLEYINRDQGKISVLKHKKNDPPTLIVTYTPYDSALRKHGFHTIASTKDDPELLVIDALFTTRDSYLNHQEQFKALDTLISRALLALKDDQKEYYRHVKAYLDDITYDEFSEALDQITWIHHDVSVPLKHLMQADGFPTRDLL